MASKEEALSIALREMLKDGIDPRKNPKVIKGYIADKVPDAKTYLLNAIAAATECPAFLVTWTSRGRNRDDELDNLIPWLITNHGLNEDVSASVTRIWSDAMEIPTSVRKLAQPVPNWKTQSPRMNSQRDTIKVQKDADSFIVPLQHGGPILPPPQNSETWLDSFDEKKVQQMGKLDFGNNHRDAPVPLLMSWQNEETLVIGRNKALYVIDPETGNSRLLFSVPQWRGRQIYDLSTCGIDGRLLVCGNTFMRGIHSFDGETKWNAGFETEFTSNPDWSRIVCCKHSSRYVHTGLNTYDKNKNLFLGFMGHGENTKYKGHEFHIHDYYANPPVRTFTVENCRQHFFLGTEVTWSPSASYLGISFPGYIGDAPRVAAVDCSGNEESLEFTNFTVPSVQGKHFVEMAWHPTRDIYAVSYFGDREGDNGPHGFAIFDAATRTMLFDQSLERQNVTTCLDWSVDGRYLALGGYDEAVLLYDFQASQTRILLGHQASIDSVSFSPDAKRLASSSSDGQTIFWGCEEPNLKIADFEGYSKRHMGFRVDGSQWSPSGRKFAGFHEGGIRVMQMRS